jgi:hypothetical protein
MYTKIHWLNNQCNQKYMAAHLTSTKYSRTYRNSQLRSGNPTAHKKFHLPLLPSGPDGVYRFLLRRTQPSIPLNSTGLTNTGLRLELNPAIADCRLQGTATSPSSATINLLLCWRRDRDSNPRGCYTYTRSRRAPSTTRPSLQKLYNFLLLCYYNIVVFANKG